MSLKSPLVHCIGLIMILAGILDLSQIYNDRLFEISHKVIKHWQIGHTEDDSMVRFFQFWGELNNDETYFLAILAVSSIISRERFWYYIIGFFFASFVKINLKMLYLEPRPNWVWSDIGSLGCSNDFGLPSGHVTICTFAVFLVLFD